jgi:hypothetical protein
MKKYVYLTLMSFLGILLATLVHAAVEFPILKFLIADPVAFGAHPIFRHWEEIHRYGGLTLSLIGITVGWWLGRYFWQVLYVEQRYGRPRW